MAELPCGCRSFVWIGDGQSRLALCALHRAAPTLRKQIEKGCELILAVSEGRASARDLLAWVDTSLTLIEATGAKTEPEAGQK